mgnify:CR=1 FL=1
MDDWKTRKQTVRAGQVVRGQPCLLLVYAGSLDSPEVGCRYDLVGDELIIGRSSDADIQVDRDSVSRRHARLARVEGGWSISDLQSTNGTYVNNEQVREQPLVDGDYLKIGNTIFRYFGGVNIVAAVHEEMYRVAVTCALTHAFNRRYFVDLLEREIARARHFGRPLSLVALDIDQMKVINEQFGHLCGDHVIHELARRLLARLDRFEVLCRYEGTQFLLLLPEIDGEGAASRGEELRHAIATDAVPSDGDLVVTTLSGGSATLASEADAAALIRTVQDAIQRAKKAGRNQFQS